MENLNSGEVAREFPRFEIPLKLRPTEFFGKESRVQNISFIEVLPASKKILFKHLAKFSLDQIEN